jgi:hypothetical protein
MEIDSFILPRDEVEPSVYHAELVALKTIVGVMATELAKWHEQVGELSARSYVSALDTLRPQIDCALKVPARSHRKQS